MKIKKDKHFRKRGGNAKIIDILCSKCGNKLFTYQKDGPGWLKRCYLNRILSPEKYEKMQYNPNIKETKDIKNLICSCKQFIGSPMIHKDKRLAFNLIRGNFKRKNNKTK